MDWGADPQVRKFVTELVESLDAIESRLANHRPGDPRMTISVDCAISLDQTLELAYSTQREGPTPDRNAGAQKPGRAMPLRVSRLWPAAPRAFHKVVEAAARGGDGRFAFRRVSTNDRFGATN